MLILIVNLDENRQLSDDLGSPRYLCPDLLSRFYLDLSGNQAGFIVESDCATDLRLLVAFFQIEVHLDALSGRMVLLVGDVDGQLNALTFLDALGFTGECR